MNNPIPVSVIITHRDRPQLLLRALASVRNQTPAPAEIIVVDDASTPSNRQPLAELPGDVRVVYLDVSQGCGGARNAGIIVATQPWIAFLDDDDEWLPNKLDRQWRILCADSSLAAVAGSVIVQSDTREDWVLCSHASTIVTAREALEDNIAFLQTLVVQASVIRSLNGFDTTLDTHEDWDFWIRFTAAGYRAYYSKEPGVNLNRMPIRRVTMHWWKPLRSRLLIVAKYRAAYIRAGGRRAVYRARVKTICRVGLENGHIAGRLLYLFGTILSGDLKSMFTLLTTGRMTVIPYKLAS